MKMQMNSSQQIRCGLCKVLAGGMLVLCVSALMAPVQASAAYADTGAAIDVSLHRPDRREPGDHSGQMAALDDAEMDGIHAQGLFWSDKITGSELSGSNAYSTPFNYYRIGLDGELALNSNISKLQLGCGGANDYLSAKAGCDIDLDYASLMGRNGTSPGNPMSAFVLKRPYIEFAVKNDGSANREIVGIKIGAQSVDGAMSVGRRYTTAGTNQENNDLLSGKTSCVPSASTGNGVVGCHSGINSVSGFLGAEMSISMRVQANICAGALVFGVCLGIPFPLDAWGCAGRTAMTADNCGTAKSDALFIDTGGTRMQSLGLRSALLDLNGQGLSGFVTALIGSAYASLNADLRTVHKLTFENTGDFFLAFQREPVAYPRYSKKTPIQEMTDNGTFATAMDACATTNYATRRCESAYAVPANTGWWLNAPSVKLLDVVNPSANLGLLSIGDALSLLAAPGYLIDQAEFNLTPAKNCYGASRFC